LENYSLAESFRLLIKEENNFLSHLKPETFRHIRRRMIETILATDISHHIKNFNALKTKFDSCEVTNGENLGNLIFDDNVIKTFENQQSVLSMIVHTADISNSAKPEQISKKWHEMEFEELFCQGDMERQNNLPISLLCDRKTTCVYKSIIGFINLAVKPAFELIIKITPENIHYVETINENLIKYDGIAKKEEDMEKI